MALLTFVKTLASICKETSFIHRLQARAGTVFSRAGKGWHLFPPWFSACQRAQNVVTGYCVHLYTLIRHTVLANQSARSIETLLLIKVNKLLLQSSRR